MGCRRSLRVVQSTAKTFVRVNASKAVPVVVERGVPMAGPVEVAGDLHAGDVVAARGSEELKVGPPVTMRPSDSKAQ